MNRLDPHPFHPDMRPLGQPFNPAVDRQYTSGDEERASRFMPASDLDGLDVPVRKWLVDGLVPSGTVTLLGGDGGTGKSLLSLQLACAVALGRSWINLPVKAGRALFISAEDDLDELHRRIADITTAEGVRPADLERLTFRSLAGENALLAVLEGRSGALVPSPLYWELNQRIEAERPAVVILDTLADLFPGNENDRAQARQFIGLLSRLATRHSCAVMLLAHPSLSGLNSGSGTSGSTGWNNSVRSRLYFERVLIKDGLHAVEDNPDRRVLTSKKANYGRTGSELQVTWQDGVFVADIGATGLDAMAQNARADRVFLRLLDDFAKQGRFVKSAPAQGYAPKAFAASGQAEGLSKQALHTAMERLFAKGEIVEVSGGHKSPSKQTMRIVRAGHAGC